MRLLFEAIFEDYLFDPGIIDLVLWFPHLSTAEFIAAAACVLCWSWLSDRFWQMVRRRLASLLRPRLTGLLRRIVALVLRTA